MICYCDGPENGHDFILESTEGNTKTYRCPVCNRPITETVGGSDDNSNTIDAISSIIEEEFA